MNDCTGALHTMHCKKIPVPFPAPSRDVTYQTLSNREYAALMKPVVFPDTSFPSLEITQNPFEKVSVPGRRQEFSRTFLFSSREFCQDLDNSFVYLFPARSFPGFSPSPDFSLELFHIVVFLINSRNFH